MRPEKRPSGDPGAIVTAFLGHIREARWTEAAGCFTPEFRIWFKENEMPGLADPGWQPVTVEDHLRRDPEMPRAMAEYLVRRASAPPRAPALGNQFAGVSSVDELHEMPALNVLARRLEATDPRTVYRRYLERVRERHPAYEEQLRSRKLGSGLWDRLSVVASAVAGRRGYAIVARTDVDDPPERAIVPPPYGVTLLAADGSWGIAHWISWFDHVAFGGVDVTDPDGNPVRIYDY